MRSKRVTSDTFKIIKRALIFNIRPWLVARKHGVSLKTVLQIRGSKDFDEYTAQNKAQHPPIKYSLADSIFELHRSIFKEDPAVKSARVALENIESYIKEKAL